MHGNRDRFGSFQVITCIVNIRPEIKPGSSFTGFRIRSALTASSAVPSGPGSRRRRPGTGRRTSFPARPGALQGYGVCQCFAHADERPDDVNAYLNCSFRVKHGSRHDGAVFRECKGEYGREFQAGEVIAFCDNLRFLCRIQLEREIFRKSMPISFYLFIQACRGYSIQLRQIRIQYDPVPPNYVNSLRNILRAKGRF